MAIQLNESNLTEWESHIIMWQKTDAFIGADSENINNDSVLKEYVNSANMQAAQLASRTNWLKLFIESINDLITITPEPNKILKLNDLSEIIANINNNYIKTKNLTINDDSISLIKKLYINDLDIDNIKFKTNSTIKLLKNEDEKIIIKIDDFDNIEFLGKANTSKKLDHTINFVDDSESNIYFNITDFSGEETVKTAFLKLKELVPDNESIGNIENPNIFYGYSVTEDARINKTFSNIPIEKIIENDELKIVSIDQISNWDKKVDNTFIPNTLLNATTSVNPELQESANIFKFNFDNLSFTDLTTNINIMNIRKDDQTLNSLMFKNYADQTLNTLSWIDSKNNEYIIWDNKNFNPDKKANVYSPIFSGIPETPTPEISLNSISEQICNVNYVNKAIKLSDQEKWEEYKNMIQFLIKNKHSMFNSDYDSHIIYHDIYQAYDIGLITKGNSNIGWDENTYKNKAWNGEKMLKIGNASSSTLDFNIYIPIEFNMIWLRVANDRWNIFEVPFYKSSITSYNYKTSAGFRNLISIAPDGGLSDSNHNYHKWVPIPINNNYPFNIVNKNNKQYKEVNIKCLTTIQKNLGQDDYWLSGIAFSTNPYNFLNISGFGIHKDINGNYTNLSGWENNNWNSDNLAKFVRGAVRTFKLPVINYLNNEDKLLYIIDRNSNTEEGMIRSIKVNGVQIERFKSTYLNPFSQHFNSKQFSRYLAAKIPKEILLNSSGILDIELDLTKSTIDLFFREIGTHDYIP